MERGSLTYWILILLLILTFTGVISLGDVFSVIFYVVGGLLLLSIVGGLIFRTKIRNLQREAERQGREWSGYRSPFGRNNGGQSEEGKVRVQRQRAQKPKKVGNDVGEYVDFEVVEEKPEKKE